MKALACPIALHPDGALLRLARETGMPLLTTPLHDDTRPDAAAARVLFDRAALETRATLPLGHSEEIVAGERWHFVLCRVVPPVRAHWQHADAQGTLRRFGWQPLDAAGDDPAVAWLRARL